jgi:hypothetical protein
MAFHMGVGEIDKARATAERALKTIHFRCAFSSDGSVGGLGHAECFCPVLSNILEFKMRWSVSRGWPTS